MLGLNDNKEFTLNEKAIAQDATRDGYLGVVTNVMDLDAKEIVESYKTLWIVEDAFGEVKGTLRARPIFHWTDPRIVGHLTLCFIAYYCESLMTKALIGFQWLVLSAPKIIVPWSIRCSNSPLVRNIWKSTIRRLKTLKE